MMRIGISALMGSLRLSSPGLHELPVSYLSRSLSSGRPGARGPGGSSGSDAVNTDKPANESDRQWQALSDVLRGKSKPNVTGGGFSDPFPGLGLGATAEADAASGQDWRQLMSLGRPASPAADAAASGSGRPEAWKKLMEDLKKGSAQAKEEPAGPPKWDLLNRYFSEDNMSASERFWKVRVPEIIRTFGRHPDDCGSTEAQVAIFSERIAYLSAHTKRHGKDHLAKKQLTAMLTQRRKLLKYLRKHDGERYGSLINAVGLKDSSAYKA